MLVYSSNSPKKKNAPQKIYIHPTIAVKLKFKKNTNILKQPKQPPHTLKSNNNNNEKILTTQRKYQEIF